MRRPANRQAGGGKATLEPPQALLQTTPVDRGQDLAHLAVRPKPPQPATGKDGLMQRDLLASRPPGPHLLLELALLAIRPGPAHLELGCGQARLSHRR